MKCPVCKVGTVYAYVFTCAEHEVLKNGSIGYELKYSNIPVAMPDDIAMCDKCGNQFGIDGDQVAIEFCSKCGIAMTEKDAIYTEDEDECYCAVCFNDKLKISSPVLSFADIDSVARYLAEGRFDDPEQELELADSIKASIHDWYESYLKKGEAKC